MDREELIKAVRTWCPKEFDYEPFDVQLFRAFLNARACVHDLRRVAAGKPSIRPLNTYPEE